MILLLLACGIDQEGLDLPNVPPPPPPALANAEPDIIHQAGVVSDVNGPTRSFILTGDGKRTIVHLRDTATLKVGGKPSLVSDVPAGTTLYVEGRRFGDFLLCTGAADVPDEPSALVPPPAAPVEAAPVEAAPVEGTPTDGAPAEGTSETPTPAPAPAVPAPGSGG